MTRPDGVPVYLTCTGVAHILGMTRSGVHNAFDRGHLRPVAYAGRVPLFDEAEVARYDREHRDRGIDWRLAVSET